MALLQMAGEYTDNLKIALKISRIVFTLLGIKNLGFKELSSFIQV